MDVSFKIYLLSGIIIIVVIILVMIRQKNKREYRDKYLNKDNLPLKYIPKKIFQMVGDKNKLSLEFKQNIEFLKNKNKGWNYTLFDDNDIDKYITENYGDEMNKLYNRINPKYGACKSDFARYLIMYLEGGAYFDIKSACKLPLDSIILPDDEYILAYWDLPAQITETLSFYGEFQQWHIICRPKHPYLYEVIKKVIDNIKNYTLDKGVGKQAVLRLSGPIAYTNTIIPIINKYNHRIIELNDFAGLIYNNISSSHKKLFDKPHYSEIKELIILN
jgi:mannosyltransferase OCH1-like enzyme